MIQAIILVCLSTLAPADCTKETATHVSPVVSVVPVTPSECTIAAMQIIASTRLSGNGRYLKILCEDNR